MATVSEYSVMSDTEGDRISGLVIRYCDRQALKDVSFDVGDGELFSLLGPNGSGKTTLFRLLSTLITPRQGALSVFGRM